MADLDAQIEKLSAAIAGLELQRSNLGDAIVDPAIAALREQLAQLERGHAPTADERKLVTIVFTDVSGFTALSEKLDPEKVRELVNACFDWLVRWCKNTTAPSTSSLATRSWRCLARRW